MESLLRLSAPSAAQGLVTPHTIRPFACVGTLPAPPASLPGSGQTVSYGTSDWRLVLSQPPGPWRLLRDPAPTGHSLRQGPGLSDCPWGQETVYVFKIYDNHPLPKISATPGQSTVFTLLLCEHQKHHY